MRMMASIGAKQVSKRTTSTTHGSPSSEDRGIDLPPGKITVEVLKGFKYKPEHRTITLKAGESEEVKVELKPLGWPSETWGRWVSGDLHVHMNYGGTYRERPRES